MSKKEKINIVRSNDFEAVEDELTAALEQLEAANERIASLLVHEHQTQLPLDAAEMPAEQTQSLPPAPQEAAPTAEEPAEAEPATQQQ